MQIDVIMLIQGMIWHALIVLWLFILSRRIKRYSESDRVLLIDLLARYRQQLDAEQKDSR